MGIDAEAGVGWGGAGATYGVRVSPGITSGRNERTGQARSVGSSIDHSSGGATWRRTTTGVALPGPVFGGLRGTVGALEADGAETEIASPPVSANDAKPAVATRDWLDPNDTDPPPRRARQAPAPAPIRLTRPLRNRAIGALHRKGPGLSTPLEPRSLR